MNDGMALCIHRWTTTFVTSSGPVAPAINKTHTGRASSSFLFFPSFLSSPQISSLPLKSMLTARQKTLIAMPNRTADLSISGLASKWCWAGDLYTSSSCASLNVRAGDFHRSPTRSTASIFGYGPNSPRSSPPPPSFRPQPSARTPVVKHPGR